MSDAAIASIVTGFVTVMLSLIGFLTLWAKLKYGEKKVEAVSTKIDANTALTKKIDGQTNGGLDDRFADHAARITALESKVSAVDAKQDAIAKTLDSTRHELRGQLQAITQLLMVAGMSKKPEASGT